MNENVGEEYDSDSDVAVDISVHPSIAVIREDCAAAQFEFDMSQWPKRS